MAVDGLDKVVPVFREAGVAQYGDQRPHVDVMIFTPAFWH
jgi:hypothetical protein